MTAAQMACGLWFSQWREWTKLKVINREFKKNPSQSRGSLYQRKATTERHFRVRVAFTIRLSNIRPGNAGRNPWALMTDYQCKRWNSFLYKKKENQNRVRPRQLRTRGDKNLSSVLRVDLKSAKSDDLSQQVQAVNPRSSNYSRHVPCRDSARIKALRRVSC